VLQVVPPRTRVLAARWPGHRAVAILFPFGEVALIDVTLFGSQAALAFEEAIVETTLVHFVVGGEVLDALAGERTLLQLAFVVTPIRPLKLALSVLLPKRVHSTEGDLTVFPGFEAEAVLLVIDPLAVVRASL
jgi:hypothetical protein